ncbi:MAG: DUF502 domain-containing protein [Alphaproteobacteria bacterium]|nr:DUF502 domain-containing protein [Alphaproteobacteria bacterium]
MSRFKFLNKLINYFIQGIFVIAPVGITIWIVVTIFNLADNFLPNIISEIFPHAFQKTNEGKIKFIPGIGLIVTLMIIILFGWFSSLFIVERLLGSIDKMLDSTPGIKLVYSTIKDIFSAFKGDKNKLNKPVLVSIENPEIWRIGFITQASCDQLGLQDYVTVYVPHSYAISGITYIVPKHKLKPLPNNISSSEAMKFVVSGGMTEVD